MIEAGVIDKVEVYGESVNHDNAYRKKELTVAVVSFDAF
jgi:hypothetical protein